MDSDIVSKGDEYSFFPRKYPHLDKYYHKMKNSYWVPSEIDFSSDRGDWLKLEAGGESGILNFIEHILSFFAQSDGIVNENLMENFSKDTSDTKEARDFYTMQAANELIHSETYGLSIETLISDSTKKAKMFDAIHNYPSIKKISEWMIHFMDPKIHILKRVIGFCCIEGILFTAAFCAIYWLKQKKIFRGLWKANEFIARDEALHTEFGVALYHHYTSFVNKFKPLKNHEIHKIISSAVSVAEEFVYEALNLELIGMNAEDMMGYVKTTADSLSVSFGAPQIYNSSNPFEWMAIISLPNKTNFFEDEVSEYGKLVYDPNEMQYTDDF